MVLARDFSRQHRIIHFASVGSASGLRHVDRGFTYGPPYTLTPGQPTPGLDYLPASSRRLPTTGRGRAAPRPPPEGDSRLTALSTGRPRHGRTTAGTGISTRCPSTTPVGLALGPDLPWADEPAPGTLGHPADGFLTRHSLLMPAFSLAWPPRLGHPAASPATRRSPTRPSPWPQAHVPRQDTPEGARRTTRLRRCA